MVEEIIGTIPMFTGLSPEERELFLKGAKQYTVEQGHVFFESGTQNVPIFVVLSGLVRVERSGIDYNVKLATLGSGASFGEMSFVDASHTRAKVVAVEETQVLEIERKAMDDILTTHPEIAVKLWRNLSVDFKNRLERTNRLVEHYIDLAQVLKEHPDAVTLLGV